MTRLAPLLCLLAAPVLADADYPAYACDGPQLVHAQETWLYPDELQALYPDLPARQPMQNVVLVEETGPVWTDLTRDALRALCLDRWERAVAPASGTWDSDLPVFHTGSCGPLPMHRPFGDFPRQITFREIFNPTVLISRSPTVWSIRRDEETFHWYLFASLPNEFSFMEHASYTFYPEGPDRLRVEGVLKDQFGCSDMFTLVLERIGE